MESNQHQAGWNYPPYNPPTNAYSPYGQQQQHRPPSNQAFSFHSSSSSLQQRLLDSQSTIASLTSTNASLLASQSAKEEKLVKFLQERKKAREEENELADALAAQHGSHVTRLEEEKTTLKEQLEDVSEELEECRKKREEEGKTLRKRVEQLGKKLGLKGRENETLREEVARELRRNEALVEEREREKKPVVVEDEEMDRVLELETELKQAREAVEIAKEEGERAQREGLEAKELQVQRLIEEKESLANALKESESKRTKQMDQFAAFSASFQSFNKRPLPSDASPPEPPLKKSAKAVMDAKYKHGMPKGEVEKADFLNHWCKTLFPKKSNGNRICEVCKNVNKDKPNPNRPPDKPLLLDPTAEGSDALLNKALLGHLEKEHRTIWTKVCSGSWESKEKKKEDGGV